MALDFSFSPEHEAVRDTVRKFAQRELLPLVHQAEETETFPRELFRKTGEQGLLGVQYPVEDGGAGMDKVSDCIVREEISYVCQGFASSFSSHMHLGVWPIWKIGTPAQKERFLRPALAGALIASFGLSEPAGGSNVRALKTRAEKVDGGWRLTGSKIYITNSPIADFVLVAARTRPELTVDAISLFLVELPNDKVAVSTLKKEGIRSSPTGEVFLDGAFVPDDCLLGGVEGTYPVILESLSENRVAVAANALGIARGAFDAAMAYAQDRQVGGRAIGGYQAIAHKLADMAADIEAARWMVYHGAWAVDRGTLDMALAAKIKLVASETAVRVTEAAVRIFGGAGIMREFPVGRMHRDALVYVIVEGTAEIQRNIIARGLGFKPQAA
jgi:alkylation response protein AidB-like acyl-CoA dehydrogenase